MRRKLKCGGKPRKKAIFGADGAIMAAATLAAAGMNVAATTAAAKQQAKAMTENAEVQGQAIAEQTRANTENVKEQMSLTRQTNKESQNALRDINLSLQMQAGQENMNNRLEASKKQLKFGGRSNRSIVNYPFYGGASFTVTDGGYVQPIAAYNNGILYEIKGNDHEHYHKTRGGKSKTGVGIKIANGEVVEGEGDQNTDRGELLFENGGDIKFISKHSIKGFNPREAVIAGMNPIDSFNIQENIKDVHGIKDDGSKAKCGKRVSLKRTKAAAGLTISTIPSLDPQRDFYKQFINGSPSSSSSSPIGSSGENNFWSNFGGAAINAGGNLIAGGLNWLGNSIAQRNIAKARNQAANIMTQYADQMTGIDLSELNADDYNSVDSFAAIRSADTNINPQLERIQRNARYERGETNRNTLSSAVKLNRLAGINDRAYQRASEQYSYKHNADEQIRQQNAQAITQVAQANADRRTQARQNYMRDKMSLLQYNNDIENQKRSIKAQALSDAITGNASDYGSMMQSGFTGIGQALATGANAFGQTFDANRVYNQNLDMVLLGADTSNKVDFAIQQAAKGNKSLAQQYYQSFAGSSNPKARKYADMLRRSLV